MNTESNQGGSDPLRKLKRTVDLLREPGGCPWDREQTPTSLRPFLLEEAHEVAEAIELEDSELLCEELGDLLMNIYLQARIAEEEGRFTLEDIANGIDDKLIRRHPHVFGDGDAGTAAEVRRTWEKIKAEEKKESAKKGSGKKESGKDEPTAPPSVLRKLPKSLPALMRAQRMGAMAAEIGFDWPSAAGALEKMREEIAELEEAIETSAPGVPPEGTSPEVAAEVGDLLFAIASFCRKSGFDAETALNDSLERFRGRFHHVEKSVTPSDPPPLEELERLWQEAKGQEAKGKGR